MQRLTPSIARPAGLILWTALTLVSAQAAAQTWNLFPTPPGGLKQVVAVNSATAWGLGNDGRTWQWSGGGWTQKGCCVGQIAVGSDGSMWAVNPADQYRILKWTGTTWTVIPGGLASISARSSNSAWGLGTDGKSWEWNGVSWTQKGCCVGQLSIGSDGTMWAVNPADSYRVLKWTGATWTVMPGGLKQISVGSGSQIWGVNSANQVFHWTGTAWASATGILQQISVASDGTLWGVSTAGDPWSTLPAPHVPQAWSVVNTHEFMREGDWITSPSRAFYATLQNDGKICVYPGADPSHNAGAAKWCNQTATASPPFAALMQSDGNLVIYKGATWEVHNGVQWQAGTNNAPGGSFRTVVRDDGVLEILGTSQTPPFSVYASQPRTITEVRADLQLTSADTLMSPNNAYRGAFENGNFKVTSVTGGRLVWSTSTTGAGNRLTISAIGNLCVVSPAGANAWCSNATLPNQSGVYRAALANSGLLYVKDASYAIWTSGTFDAVPVQNAFLNPTPNFAVLAAGEGMCWRDEYDRGVGVPISSCASNLEKDGALCYDRCRAGYYGVGPVCWSYCPSGWSDDGATCRQPITSYAEACAFVDCDPGYTCWGVFCGKGGNVIAKDTYTRGVGYPLQCAPNQQADAGLCYTPCQAGYSGTATMCWHNCTPIYPVMCGLACATSSNSCISGTVNMVASVAIMAQSTYSFFQGAGLASYMGRRGVMLTAGRAMNQQQANSLVMSTGLLVQALGNQANAAGISLDTTRVSNVAAAMAQAQLDGQLSLEEIDPINVVGVIKAFLYDDC